MTYDNLQLLNLVFHTTVRKGGITIGLDGQTPKTGYMVGLVGCKLRASIQVFHPHIVRTWLEIVYHRALQANHYVGTWADDGFVYMDVSENIRHLADAIVIGKERRQIAIWDVEKAEEIRL